MKSAFKFALPVRVRRKRVAGLGFAHGLDAQHFGGDIADGAFASALLPCASACRRACERRTHFAHADVFADEMRLGRRARKVWAILHPNSPARIR